MLLGEAFQLIGRGLYPDAWDGREAQQLDHDTPDPQEFAFRRDIAELGEHIMPADFQGDRLEQGRPERRERARTARIELCRLMFRANIACKLLTPTGDQLGIECKLWLSDCLIFWVVTGQALYLPPGGMGQHYDGLVLVPRADFERAFAPSSTVGAETRCRELTLRYIAADGKLPPFADFDVLAHRYFGISMRGSRRVWETLPPEARTPGPKKDKDRRDEALSNHFRQETATDTKHRKT